MRSKRILTIAAALLLAVLLAVPAMALSAGTATVKADWLNFREAPSMDGLVMGLAPNGTEVEILEDLGEWCRVRWDARVGYMSSRYLVQEAPAQPKPEEEPAVPAQPEPAAQPEPSAAPAPAEPEPAAQSVTPAQPEPEPEPAAQPEEPAEEAYPQVGILTGDAVRFREKPDLSSEIYGHFYCGDRVSVLGQEGDWCRVEYGGKIGYVYGLYVSISKPAEDGNDGAPAASNDLADSIVAIARKNLGVPYVYGGASPNGFDCSGLVYYCYLQSGRRIERTATAQFRQGVYVEKDKLEKGDLVFFVSPGTQSIGHVGIYIGNGEFIHASTGHGYIMIAELSNSYFTTYYYGACRIA